MGRNARKNTGEKLGVVGAALAVFLALAFLSYEPGNPRLNLAGQVGHALADRLLPALGLSVYLLPPYLGYLTLVGFRLFPLPSPLFQLLSFGTFLLSVSVFLALKFEGEAAEQAGGWIGGFLALHVRYLFNRPGAYVLLFPLMLLSLMGTAHLSLAEVGGSLGRRLKAVGTKGGELILGLWVWRQRERGKEKTQSKDLKTREKKAEAKERPVVEEARSLPVIVTEPVEEQPLPPPLPRKKNRLASSFLEVSQGGGPYRFPPLSLLDPPVRLAVRMDEEVLHASSRILEKKLADFGVEGKVVAVRPGPVITTYEFEPAPGIKVNRIASLADDLSMALRAVSVRILGPIPGKAAVGIEVSNPKRERVCLREILDHAIFQNSESVLTLALGKDTAGSPVVADLARMPHLLVAGATGTGKSVFLNATIMSLLYKGSPQEIRLLMIDPKMLELSLYEEIPHLLSRVVTNPREAGAALQEMVRQMEHRYRLLHHKGVRSIGAYNRLLAAEREATEEVIPLTEVVEEGELPQEPLPEGDRLEHRPLPFIVIIVDELADLMLTMGREVEEPITRLAQMGRAAGIHLVLATQRPSVDVLTGIIKANFPARASFQVSSRADSRTILDNIGAERLLGEGDMLFLHPGTARAQRIHGAYVSETEVRKVVDFVKKQARPAYDHGLAAAMERAQRGERSEAEEEEEYDDLYEQARELVLESRQASISWLQRRLRVGYNRAARMIERMEREGLIAPAAEAGKPREVLVRLSRGEG